LRIVVSDAKLLIIFRLQNQLEDLDDYYWKIWTIIIGRFGWKILETLAISFQIHSELFDSFTPDFLKFASLVANPI